MTVAVDLRYDSISDIFNKPFFPRQESAAKLASDILIYGVFFYLLIQRKSIFRIKFIIFFHCIVNRFISNFIGIALC